MMMVMDRHKNREAAAQPDYGHGENKGGKNLFHNNSRGSDTPE